jgi:hypothetical protein
MVFQTSTSDNSVCPSGGVARNLGNSLVTICIVIDTTIFNKLILLVGKPK